VNFNLCCRNEAHFGTSQETKTIVCWVLGSVVWDHIIISSRYIHYFKCALLKVQVWFKFYTVTMTVTKNILSFLQRFPNTVIWTAFIYNCKSRFSNKEVFVFWIISFLLFDNFQYRGHRTIVDVSTSNFTRFYWSSSSSRIWFNPANLVGLLKCEIFERFKFQCP